ncbi:hypothetical protein [Lysobacter capsici]|uniref:hypothetical protein n=1 Tax=Lysobacter capsici TaxID=435897 RepID=UPI00398D4C16
MPALQKLATSKQCARSMPSSCATLAAGDQNGVSHSPRGVDHLRDRGRVHAAAPHHRARRVQRQFPGTLVVAEHGKTVAMGDLQNVVHRHAASGVHARHLGAGAGITQVEVDDSFHRTGHGVSAVQC